MSIRLNSNEQEELVIKNRGLVYHLVNNLGTSQNQTDYEDLVSIGTIGLIKAAASFDDSKNIKFATYASRCINNEIFMHFRKEKSHANDISLDDPIASDSDGNEVTLADKIPSTDRNFAEIVEENAIFERVINIILNLLKSKERMIMLYEMSGTTQRSIAESLNISQSYISRLEKKLSYKLKSYLTNSEQFKEVFSMTMVDDLYKITFSSKEIKHFNNIFATFLLNLTSIEAIPNFKVSCSKERVIIQVPANPESFAFIARIIQEIDEFSITFETNKASLSANEDMASNKTIESKQEAKKSSKKDTKISTGKTDIKNISQEIEESQTTEVNPTNDNVLKPKTDENPKVKKDNKAKRIRDYVLTKESFTVKELAKQFPDLNTGDIGNALHIAKNKGLITSTGKGKYIVNKN